MKYHVKTYIAQCMQCQKNKHSTHSMYKEIRIMKLLDIPWKEITIDFIIKLLKLKEKDSITKIFYNSIMVVVNKLIKYVYFILFKKTFDTKQLQYFFINWII